MRLFFPSRPMICLVFHILQFYHCQQVFLKNLPPNSSLIEEIMDRVKGFLISKALLKGDSSTTSRPLRHLRGESVSVHLQFVFMGLKYKSSAYKTWFRRNRMERGTYKGDPLQKHFSKKALQDLYEMENHWHILLYIKL